jgi:heptaprenyl diphosphate synthase
MTDASRGVQAADRLGFEEAVFRTEQEIRRLLKGAPKVIRHMTAHLGKAAGMIRAKALLTCAVGGDNGIRPDAVKAAAAAELLHLATLVHDDIIDQAVQRRGIDTLQRKFGEKYAVLCGDYLFCVGLELIAAVKMPEHRQNALDRTFLRYMTEVCLGEMRQNRNSHNFRLSERAYFKIIRGKTAALFEACFITGLMFSDEEESSKDIYKELGGNIGIIFQLADDCADYESTLKLAKKPVLSDYSHGVITLPLIYALKKDAELSLKIAAGMALDDLGAAVSASGGLVYTHKKIDELYKKTSILLQSLNIGNEKREMLKRLLQMAAGILT